MRLDPLGPEGRDDLCDGRAVAEADERLLGDLAQRRRGAPASGESAATISTYGSRSSSTVSSGASPTGSSTKPTSSSPRSIAPTISSSSSSSSITSICGHSSVKRRISSGRTRAPTDWNVPTRERARLAGLERAEVGLGGLEARDDRLGVPQQERAGLGQRDRARAAGPLDEPLADDPLERRDLLADRRLRVAEPLRGAAERALVRERLQRGEVAHLDAEPTIRFHDRYQSYSICADSPCSGTLSPWQQSPSSSCFVAVCVLAAWFGVDSRPVEHGPHRPNWS